MVVSKASSTSSTQNPTAAEMMYPGMEDSKLVKVQLDSFERFEKEGIRELLDEIFPIEDELKGRFRMVYGDEESGDEGFELRERRHPSGDLVTEADCIEQGINYSKSLYVRVRLINKERDGELAEQTIFFGDIPKMTTRGTFIVNGSERVVVSQIVRSPGAYFSTITDQYTGVRLSQLKIIPDRGAWIEASTAANGAIFIKIDRRRKLPFTTMLQAFGMTSKAIEDAFSDVEDVKGAQSHVKATFARDTTKNHKEALQELYKRLRPEEPTISDMNRAMDTINRTFFNTRYYDLSKVGRMMLNRRLKKDYEGRVLSPPEMVELVKEMIRINNGAPCTDDVDHMGNRRVRAVGELLQKQLRGGFLRLERSVLDKMTMIYHDPDEKVRISPAAFINNRPIITAARNFFTGSQLSQFMDQTNPLAELTHKRRISSMGAGGLTRDRASFDVRDVHYSHYGRLCPIETPEGPNIGLLSSLATFAEVDESGLIRTPYKRVKHDIQTDDPGIVGHTVKEDVLDDNGKKLVAAGDTIKSNTAEKLRELKPRKLLVKPYITEGDVVYLTADIEEKHKIAQANTRLDNNTGQFKDDIVEVRQGENFMLAPVEEVGYIDYSARQMVSVTTALIPFLEYDDANRALMGSNMQRQAVPLIKPQSPLVGTGMENIIARNSGRVLLAKDAGIISYVSSERIEIVDDKGETQAYKLIKFKRSNQGTCINQRPTITPGQIVVRGQAIADSYASDGGEMALGQNLLVGFMSWEGYNFEDAIVINQDLVRDDRFTSTHIEKYEVSARETPLGDEEITADISNVSEDRLSDLDEFGVVREGAWVESGDILVGKISPKGETELTAEEKLLRAIFGDKARDVKDTSLRLPHGQRGRVIKIQEMNRSDKSNSLSPSVIKTVRIWVAHTRKIGAGDKMAGRHGNKGVVAQVLPREDMPFLPDGRPLDIVLNPIGVPSRMNLGQLLETHIGLAASVLGKPIRRPVFESMTQAEVEDNLALAWFVRTSGAADISKVDETVIDEEKLTKWLSERGYNKAQLWRSAQSAKGHVRDACLKIWLKEVMNEELPQNLSSTELMKKTRQVEKLTGISSPTSGKTVLYDGRTGERFMEPVTVGNIYMMKLLHIAEDKIHARSTGPYSLITQQPLGGKAQFGGQRLGEMEVWALQAYSAARVLQEMLTIKSDNVSGRYRAYDAMSKGDLIELEGVPESFNVLVKEMQSLCLQVELLGQHSSTLEDGIDLGDSLNVATLDEEDMDETLFDLEELNVDSATDGVDSGGGDTSKKDPNPSVGEEWSQKQ